MTGNPRDAENCAHCGCSLGSRASDEEDAARWEEHDRVFGGVDRGDAVCVCDACFEKMCPGGKADPKLL